LKKLKISKYQLIFKVLFWLALGVSYVAAILPQDIAPTIGSLSDKAHHVFAFIVLGLLLRLAYPLKYWQGLLILVGYGIFIELSQYFTPNRMAEVKDVLADLLGSFIGLKLYSYIKRVI